MEEARREFPSADPRTAEIQQQVTVIVAAHKPYRMPEDPMYLPVHVGAALHPDQNPGMLPDDTGEHISELNPGFSELTGLYFAWKQLDAAYIGLVHYRRHFRTLAKKRGKDPFRNILTFRDIEPLLPQVKVFLPAKRHYYIETLYSHYAHTHDAGHLDITREILRDKYPDYLPAYEHTLKRRSGCMFNMLIMERSLLNDYLSWLFDILFALKERTGGQNYSAYQGRYFGRVSEILLNVWIEQQLKCGRLKAAEIRYLPLLSTEPVHYFKKASAFLKAKFLHRKYESSF